MTASQDRVGSTTLRAARNAAFSAGSDVAGKVATLVWTVLAARLLGQGDFGTFFYSLTLALLISAAAEWGFNGVMVQRSSRDRSLLPALFTRSVSWQITFATPLFLIGGAVAAWFRPTASARLTLALVFAAALLDLWSGTCRAASAAAQDQRGTAGALVLQRVSTAVLISGALLAGGGVVHLAAAFLAGSLVGAVAHGRALRRLDVRYSRGFVARAPMRQFVGQTWLLGMTALTLMALFRIDAVLLAALAGDAAVGAYAAAYRLLETVLFIAFAVRSAVFPVMNVRDDVAVVARGVQTGIASVGLVYLPFAVVCIVEAGPLLHLLYGEPYDDVSRGPLVLLSLAPMVYAITYFTMAGLQARRRFRLLLSTALLACGLNVVLNLVLIPEYGGSGAAFATTVSYAFAGAWATLSLHRSGLQVNVLRPLAEPAAASLPLAAALVLLPLPVLPEVALGAIVYLGAWTLLARRTSPEHLLVVRGLARGVTGRRSG